MAEYTPRQRITPDERLYARARWGFVAVLALLFALDLSKAFGTPQRLTFLAMLVLMSVSSAVLSWNSRQGEPRFVRAMLWVLVPDLICVAGFTYALYPFETGFFPVAVMLPAMYALMLPKREAWITGLGSALAYVSGHAFAYTHTLLSGRLVLHLLGACSIPLLTAMVAASVERQRQREEETVVAVGQREVALGQISRRISELQAVSQITEIVHSSLDFERVGPLVLEILAKVLGVDTCCLFVIDKERSETLFSASIGTLAGISPIPGDAELRYMDVDGHFSCMAAFDHSGMMVLFCATAEDIERLTEEDRLVLGAVASELVVAAENSRLYKLTKKLAVTDELTGLANYRHLQSKLEEEVARAERYGKQLSLLMLDVDDFKRFNDTQGHIAGDQAIADLARVLESAVREVDLVARYGGEEFAVVLPETDAAGAFVVAEKVRETVAESRFTDCDGERHCHVTVSIGLATFPVHGKDREAILREADDALYRAKSGGKNRVRTPRTRPPAESATIEPDVVAPAASGDDEWTGV